MKITKEQLKEAVRKIVKRQLAEQRFGDADFVCVSARQALAWCVGTHGIGVWHCLSVAVHTWIGNSTVYIFVRIQCSVRGRREGMLPTSPPVVRTLCWCVCVAKVCASVCQLQCHIFLVPAVAIAYVKP